MVTKPVENSLKKRSNKCPNMWQKLSPKGCQGVLVSAGKMPVGAILHLPGPLTGSRPHVECFSFCFPPLVWWVLVFNTAAVVTPPPHLLLSSTLSPPLSVHHFQSSTFSPPFSAHHFQSSTFSPPLSVHHFQSSTFSHPLSVHHFQSSTFDSSTFNSSHFWHSILTQF